MNSAHLPPFRPHPLLRSGHAQTLAGMFLQGKRLPYSAKGHEVPLTDGDALMLHDDLPQGWRQGDRTAVLVHGMAGCHGSPYMWRVADRLKAAGVRAFRLDLRGGGAGERLARRTYHGGCSEDIAAALEYVARLCPSSPTTLAGFSLGGNIILKLLGESRTSVPGNVDGAVAACPPIDLAACCRNLRRGARRLYDRHFARLLMRRLKQRERNVPGAAMGSFARAPRGMEEFDEGLTAPIWGYKNAADYYHQCSAAPFLSRIQIPTLILAAANDPLVPIRLFNNLNLPPQVQLHIIPGGGHLGFIAAAGVDTGKDPDPDRRWLDWRVIQWAMQKTPSIDKTAALDYQ